MKGPGGAVMPGQGRATSNAITHRTRLHTGRTHRSHRALPALSTPTFDIRLNVNAFWSNAPSPAIWRYKIGGYRVLKRHDSAAPASRCRRPPRPLALLLRRRERGRFRFDDGYRLP